MAGLHRLSSRRPRQIALAALAALLLVPHVANSQAEFRTGQNIQPAFDGYEVNSDGTYTLWFAYLNRNYEQVLDIPIGPDNAFTPPPGDRGQPTHFLPRRHKSMFGVVVPQNFGTLTWTLTAYGQTASAIAKPNPRNIINRKRSTLGPGGGKLVEEPDNTPPEVTVQPQMLTLKKNEHAHIAIGAKDDGRPTTDGHAIGLAYTASVYRGVGRVTLTPAAAKLDAQGKADIEISFADPGEYTLQIRIDDGSSSFGSFCCWTDTLVHVTVRG